MADLVEFGERRLGGIVYRLINWSKNSNETVGLVDARVDATSIRDRNDGLSTQPTFRRRKDCHA